MYRSSMYTVTPSGIKVYTCGNANVDSQTCILSGSSAIHAICRNCTNRQEEVVFDWDTEWTYITTHQLAQDALILANYVPSNCSGIAGVARSGILPASILATHLQLPLYSARIAAKGVELVEMLPQDIHRGGKEPLPKQDGPIFIVDDTVHSGGCLSTIRAASDNAKHIYSAVYVTPEYANITDCYVRKVKTPHFLEWNMFNNGFVCGGPAGVLYGGLAFDFDGVLCNDPKPGEEYTDPSIWISNLKPTHMLPRRYRIPLIITMRLEAWRKPTLEWLDRYRIKYDRVEMCDSKSIADRDKNFINKVIEHKAYKFKNSDCYMMVESDEGQSRLINEYAKKPVLCIATKQIIQ